jgi:uncharacterized protein YndB with AHSA1/START domain
MRKGFSMISSTIELKPGGFFHHGLRSADGSEIWGKWVFHEVVVPKLLVFVISFSDEKGSLTRHPLSADWPPEVISNMTLAPSNGGTLFTMRLAPLNASDAECRAFEAAFQTMQRGWAESLEELASYLAND